MKRDAIVFLIDADPQCNTTELILGEDITAEIYVGKKKYDTLYNVLAPVDRCL